MRDICTIAEPLWSLTKANVDWKRGEVESAAFDALKRAISTKCVGYFKKNWTTVLTVDASPVGLGAVLQQFDPRNPKERQVVSCISRMLTDVERRYSQCEKEALGVVWGCERLWMYLLGKPFVIETDNRAVKLIFASTKSKPPARIERLALRLSQFDYEIVHRPGETNVADYYSRHPVKTTREDFLEEVRASSETERYINAIAVSSLPRSVTVDEIREATKSDPEIQELLKCLGKKNGKDFLAKSLSNYKLIFHELIRSRLWFPGIDAKVERKVKQCLECQATDQKRNYEPLRPSEMPQGPWQEVSADFFGPMPDGAYWFVNSCDYAKWVSVARLSSVSFEQVEPVLVKLFRTIGIPSRYKTDNGSPFQSHNFKLFAERYGFKHRKVTPYWPRANATAENVMRKLNKVLKIAKLEGKKPDSALSEFLAVYHDTPHSATGVAPNVLMFGRARTSGLPMLERDDLAYQASCHKQAREQHKAYSERMKMQYDQHMRARECPIREGDRVLFKRDITRKDVSAWDPEPFTVDLVKGSLITVSRTYPRQQSITRNSSCFKLFTESDIDEEPVAPGPAEEAIGDSVEPASIEPNQVDQPQISNISRRGKILCRTIQLGETELAVQLRQANACRQTSSCMHANIIAIKTNNA